MCVKHRILLIFLGGIPSVAFAEVSDKLPSIQSNLLLGLLIGIGLFFLARFRWKFGIFLFVIPLVISEENYSLWSETGMREAVLKEQGWLYFVALGTQCLLLFAGVIGGIWYGYLRSTRKF